MSTSSVANMSPRISSRRTLGLVMLCLTSLLLFSHVAVQAADEDTTSANARIDVKKAMKEVRAKLSKEKYKSALRQLKKVTAQEPRNADAWNLRGYSERKLGKFKRAGKAYSRALELNPNHKGALEYQGELYLQQNLLDKANANRIRIAALCPDGCKELDNLDKVLNGEGKQIQDW